MNVDALLDRLDGVRPAGAGQFNAQCPSHLDRHASLSVGETVDRIVLHCHAGCGPNAILESLGLSWRDVFLDTPDLAPRRNGPVTIPKPRPRAVSRRRDESRVSLPPAPILASWTASVGAVAGRLFELKGWTLPTLQALEIGWDGGRVTIPVRDADGLLLTVVRYLPGRKPKMLALNGRGRHLYPAPEDVAFFDDPFGAVWLVEGEPDAISAYELGIPAVAVPGVSKWSDEWTERFEGRVVTVCMDCDAAGRACAAERADMLHSVGVEVRVVDLDPNRTDGWDLGDALTGATREGRLDDLKAYLARLEADAWR